ncbi:hypothetical protein ROZALSC1DRAFT_27241 [Rozella allomycis CSF55]|uniref:Nicastrin n=1 Tax=Rozella allomycis (strain CSF55) TaxID=988480 RepID=A0A4V1J0F1_ROZAC|nr:hypothetical protein ROZALSC1DRAFT_27241 [Rozella allomycis CSF55]
METAEKAYNLYKSSDIRPCVVVFKNQLPEIRQLASYDIKPLSVVILNKTLENYPDNNIEISSLYEFHSSFPIVYVRNEKDVLKKLQRTLVEYFPEWMPQDPTACCPVYLEPIGGQNILSSLKNVEETGFLLTGLLDSRSLFPYLTEGVYSHVSSLVLLLSAFEALSKVTRSDFKHNVHFLALSAEQYGQTGSKRFLKDLHDCNRDPNLYQCQSKFISNAEYLAFNHSKLKGIIDLGALRSNKPYIRFSDSNSQFLVEKLQNISTPSIVYQPIQIDSYEFLSSFNSNVPKISLSDVSKVKETPLNFAFLDDLDSYLQDQKDQVISNLCQIGTNVATLLYQLSTEKLTSVTVDCKLIEDFLHCFSSNFSCPIITDLYPVGTELPRRVLHNPRVFRPFLFSSLTEVVFLYFSKKTVTNSTDISCKDHSDCSGTAVCFDNFCKNTQTYNINSYGPGIYFDTDDGSWKATNDEVGYVTST